MFTIWIMLKLIISILVLRTPKERDINHLIGLSSYSLCTDMAAAVFIFHFVLFIKNIQLRLEKFRESFCTDIELLSDDKIEAFDAYGILFNLLVCLIGKLNLIFRLQVVELLLITR